MINPILVSKVKKRHLIWYTILIIILAIIFISSHKTNAEPSRAISALMNEPFSMFDWGMYRLRNHVLSTENKIRKNLEWFALEDDIPIVPQILEILHEMEIISVIVEGGAYTLNRFIESGLWDEARVFTGNKEFGAGVAAPVLSTPPAEKHEISPAQLSVYYNN